MLVSNHIYDAREAGFHIFGIYGADSNGNCECGNPDCKAPFKHPRVSAWQNVPFYSEEQFDVMAEANYLATGYGILVRNLLIIDVDARNGGLDSFEKLCNDLNCDLVEKCEYVVETGSGGGSMHLYFKSPTPPIALMQMHPNYKGIDFKSSGYVVGAGSKHKSGSTYEVKKGYPQDIQEPPLELIKLLEKRQHYRAAGEHGSIDVKLDELRDVVMAITNETGGHERWLSVGMGIHDTTSGDEDGLQLWIDWSSDKPNFDPVEMETRWHSFGKSINSITFATLMHHAKLDGYSIPVTFDDNGIFNDVSDTTELSLDDKVKDIDIRQPHGFAGILCEWVNNQCRLPRENLSVAAALYILSCVGGMRHIDDRDGMTLNFMPFGVAGSATGKEAIFQAVNDALQAVGIMGALHGKFKSEQEFTRNLLRHQAAFYNIDELGIELEKIHNAAKRGGAAYLSGMIGEFMKVYSKANGTLPVSGDLKEEMREKIQGELKSVYKKMDEQGETEELKEIESTLIRQIKSVDNGIVNPYFCMFGLTTPITFDKLMNFEMATNGFFGRAVIFNEKNTIPRIKKGFKPTPMPPSLQVALTSLYAGGESDTGHRVQAIGEKLKIITTGDASALLDEVYEYFYNEAVKQQSTTGLEAICNRAWEICSKVSLLTAMATRVRTEQDVLYGFAVAKADMHYKISLAYSNDAAEAKDTRGDALLVRIQSLLDHDNPMTIGVLYNRLRGFSRDDVNKAIEFLLEKKKIMSVDAVHKKTKEVTKKYLLFSAG